MIFGPDLSGLREYAKTQVMQFFVGKAEADGTPATLRALYVMKAAEAATVLAGGSSDLIEGEAALRGIEPVELAQTVSDMAKQSADLELARMKINVQIEAASTAGEIVEILKTLGIDLMIS
jgi:hypothetical protein